MSQGVTVTYSRGMRKLLDGGWLDGDNLGIIAKEIVRETIGNSSISKAHFSKGQGKWPDLANSTKEAKGNSKKFFKTGNVLRAISTNPNAGKLMAWGSSKSKKKKYVSNGIYGSARVDKQGITVTTGFSGKLRHSSGFNKVRKSIALEKGVNLNGMKASERRKAINKAVSVSDVSAKIKDKKGKRVTKFAPGGSNSKQSKQGKSLAYANVVQYGVYGGNRKARPLMPYESSDSVRLSRAIERGVSEIFRKIEKEG